MATTTTEMATSAPAINTTNNTSIHLVTDGTRARLPAATALHGKTFANDPVLQWLLHDMPTPARTAYLPTYIGVLLKAAALNGATFDEAWTSPAPPASDSAAIPSCSAVWLPPGRRVDDWRHIGEAGFLGVARRTGWSGLRRMLFGFQAESERAKKMGLGRRDGRRGKVAYHYLFFISTAVEERGKGLSSALIRRFQEKVVEERKGLPIWLESTTEKSRRVYSNLGFEDVHTWLVGKGEVDKDGLAAKGGEGARIWAMVWWPPAVSGDSKEHK